MRALTLHQPWATLIALGIKTIETRSWPPPRNLMGQTVAIHAGRTLQPNPGPEIEAILRLTHSVHWRRRLPAGAVVATATVRGSCQVTGLAAGTVQAITRCGQIIATTPTGISEPDGGYGSSPTSARSPNRCQPPAGKSYGTGNPPPHVSREKQPNWASPLTTRS